MTATPQ